MSRNQIEAEAMHELWIGAYLAAYAILLFRNTNADVSCESIDARAQMHADWTVARIAKKAKQLNAKKKEK